MKALLFIAFLFAQNPEPQHFLVFYARPLDTTTDCSIVTEVYAVGSPTQGLFKTEGLVEFDLAGIAVKDQKKAQAFIEKWLKKNQVIIIVVPDADFNDPKEMASDKPAVMRMPGIVFPKAYEGAETLNQLLVRKGLAKPLFF